MDMTRPSGVIRSRESRQVKEPDESRSSIRLVDFLSLVPSSREFQDVQDEQFDMDAQALRITHIDVSIPWRLKRWMASKIDESSMMDIQVTVDFLLDSFANKALKHFYSLEGLRGVYTLMRCSANPYIAIMTEVDDMPIDQAWRLVMRTMPSCSGGTEGKFTSKSMAEFPFRTVTEIERGPHAVGPFIEVVTPEGITRKAYIDVMSTSYDCDEYIVFGTDERYTTTIDGNLYACMTHIDCPGTKTAAFHYRLYGVSGSSDLTFWVSPLPVIFNKMMKAGQPQKNILPYLPYAADIQEFLLHRPDLGPLCRFMIFHIIMGYVFKVDDYGIMVDNCRRFGSIPTSDVFNGTQYRKTLYSNRNHGVGAKWNAVYNKMF